ncbi:MAG: hypothetical protein JST40_09265 [Armatimonadetes bacterium]|nr:hypothetical protein [Armatimonadota bacterium]
MQKSEPTPDLLIAYESERVRRNRIRKYVLYALGAIALVLGFAEPVVNQSEYILGGILLGALAILAFCGIFGYVALVAFMTYSYAEWVMSRGSLRPSGFHLFTILLLSAIGAALLAGYTIREHIEPSFWVAILFVVWTNILSGFLGYLGAFWFRAKTRTPRRSESDFDPLT